MSNGPRIADIELDTISAAIPPRRKDELQATIGATTQPSSPKIRNYNTTSSTHAVQVSKQSDFSLKSWLSKIISNLFNSSTDSGPSPEVHSTPSPTKESIYDKQRRTEKLPELTETEKNSVTVQFNEYEENAKASDLEKQPALLQRLWEQFRSKPSTDKTADSSQHQIQAKKNLKFSL